MSLPDQKPTSQFKIFHDLMSWKVSRILLVSRPYDAWIMDKDQPLAESIIHEYHGLNLSHPPRLVSVPTAALALKELARQEFDLVIAMPHLTDMSPEALAKEIKKTRPELAIVLLSHSPLLPRGFSENHESENIDQAFVWSGDPDIVLAMIKCVEDRRNVDADTAAGGIRVILFVEDSPGFVSLLLPILYRELVLQTQGIIEHSLNEEERLLSMRARPKVLLAQSYEEAMGLYRRYEPYILGVIADARFSRAGHVDARAGMTLLTQIHHERFDVPLLMISSEPQNARRAQKIPAMFADKNSPTLQDEVRYFLKAQLGFGEFIFRLPDGREVARAANLRGFEKTLSSIPAESFNYHCLRNDFSRWLFARTEINLATSMRCLTDADFDSVESHRGHLLDMIKATQRGRRRGHIVDFDPRDFNEFTEFAKLGKGSMGGKGRGLSFFSSLLHTSPQIQAKFPEVEICLPQTLLVATEGFDRFVDQNGLRPLAKADSSDQEVAARFLAGRMPADVSDNLEAYLEQVKNPLAVRSSSLLEDAQFQAYAGLYKTYMLPNKEPELERRLAMLTNAVKLIYASTYFQNPKEFSRRVGNRIEEEKMGVIVQPVCGRDYGGHFYPAISGVAQSYNYYPFGKMDPADGVATIALGLGKTVMEGGKAVRFSPQNPELALQVTSLEDFLNNAQREFFAIPMDAPTQDLSLQESHTLARRDVFQARDEPPVKLLCSTYMPSEHRLYDGPATGGYPVVTFTRVLKYGLFPLGGIISELLSLGSQGMGGPVEIEFSVDLPADQTGKPSFCVLQLRPMAAREDADKVEISAQEEKSAFLVSHSAQGNRVSRDIRDIIYVDPRTFKAEATSRIAREIGRLNQGMDKKGLGYILIGPGRWGSADPWLGIPVQWRDISAVTAMVEATYAGLSAEPSQGSHFFYNINALGINYITIGKGSDDFIDWNFLAAQPQVTRTIHVRHVRLERPMVLKVDGRSGRCVIHGGGDEVPPG